MRAKLDAGEERSRNLLVQKPVTILQEHGMVPNLASNRQPDEPAEQEVVVQLLDQHPLRANRVKHQFLKPTRTVARTKSKGNDQGSSSFELLISAIRAELAPRDSTEL